MLRERSPKGMDHVRRGETNEEAENRRQPTTTCCLSESLDVVHAFLFAVHCSRREVFSGVRRDVRRRLQRSQISLQRWTTPLPHQNRRTLPTSRPTEYLGDSRLWSSVLTQSERYRPSPEWTRSNQCITNDNVFQINAWIQCMSLKSWALTHVFQWRENSCKGKEESFHSKATSEKGVSFDWAAFDCWRAVFFFSVYTKTTV